MCLSEITSFVFYGVTKSVLIGVVTGFPFAHFFVDYFLAFSFLFFSYLL